MEDAEEEVGYEHREKKMMIVAEEEVPYEGRSDFSSILNEVSFYIFPTHPPRSCVRACFLCSPVTIPNCGQA